MEEPPDSNTSEIKGGGDISMHPIYSIGNIGHFRGGYTSMWKRLGESLPVEVHCSSEVLAIMHNSDGVSVNVKNNGGEIKTLEFDKIILFGAFSIRNRRTYRSPSLNSEIKTKIIGMNDIEKELFSKVQTIDYYTTVLKIKGLEYMPKGFYHFNEFMEDPSTIGHPIAVQRFYEDTDIFLFWSYRNSENITEPVVTKLEIDVVERIGAKVETVILQRRFKYFPHVNSQVLSLLKSMTLWIVDGRSEQTTSYFYISK